MRRALLGAKWHLFKVTITNFKVTITNFIVKGVIFGLIIRTWTGEQALSPIFAFTLIILATVISLLRVTPLEMRTAFDERLVAGDRLLARFALLPLLIGVLGSLSGNQGAAWMLAFALLFAAPRAITALIISRSAGGMVQPSVYMILLSTLVSAMVMYPLLASYHMTAMSSQAFLYVVISVLGLFLPLLAARWLRNRYPISSAKFAERNAATAVLLLTLFVMVSFQSIELASFWPYGVYAFGVALAMRLVAFLLARRNSRYAVDDFISMGYPNIFLVILLAEMLAVDPIAQLATWFLVPMFALAPLDDYLCRRLQKDARDPLLRSFLRVDMEPVRVQEKEES